MHLPAIKCPLPAIWNARSRPLAFARRCFRQSAVEFIRDRGAAFVDVAHALFVQGQNRSLHLLDFYLAALDLGHDR